MGVRDMSEAAEEGEELIVWPVAAGWCVRRREPGEGTFFVCDVGMHVDLCGGGRVMAEP